jgi:hypothetical protein
VESAQLSKKPGHDGMGFETANVPTSVALGRQAMLCERPALQMGNTQHLRGLVVLRIALT